MPEKKAQPRNKFEIKGDVFMMNNEGPGIAIGKFEGGADQIGPAVEQLTRLLHDLREEGLIDDQGEATDEEELRQEVGRRRGGLGKLTDALGRRSDAVLNGASGGAISVITKTLLDNPPL